MYHSSSVDYMGNVIVPIVTQDPSGFKSTAIITDKNGDGQAIGALGCFATEAQVRQSGRPALVATMAMADVSRAREKGETRGFMKVLVDAQTKQILGASLLGTAGDEVIHCIIDVMYAKAPYTLLQRAMHVHPTVSEWVPTMLEDLMPLLARADEVVE